MELDKEIFKGKTIGDLVEEVYNKHKNQDSTLKQEIMRLADMIETPGDAIVVVPLLKGFFDSSLKNDEVLMKLLALFQKAADNKKDNTEDNGLLTEKDIEQLFSEVSNIKIKDPKQLPSA
jgi:outer membrane PBP1 activator LpoA protein